MLFLAHCNALKQKRNYTKAFKQYGYDVRSLCWISDTTQKRRFDNMLKISDISNTSVIDIGCGFGDLFGYFLEKHISVQYLGIDVMPNFIRKAKEIYPGGSFVCKNIAHIKLPVCDYAFCSGLFAYGNQKLFDHILKKVYASITKGFAFTLYQTKDRAFFSPSKPIIYNSCKELSPKNIVISEDSCLNDLTTFIYK